MLVFCPTCGSLLQIEEGRDSYRFACKSCPYVLPVTRTVTSRSFPQPKNLDEVLGGPGAWENFNVLNALMTRPYFMQLQTRSADEPMTIFYRCANSDCAHRWKD